MIEVANLGKTYVDAPVVRNLSFFVPEGQVLGFLGPNGAGKTTVMRMLTAFLPPTTGRVVVAGVDLDQDPVALRRNIGYLPENVPLYPELRVDEYLRFRADIEEVPRAEVRDRMDDVVEQCLIGDVSRQVIGTLSKGYRQRVGLAGALIHRPPVLILDEPTVGLDPNQIIKVRELITELGRDHTVLLSTHILPEVQTTCDRVLIINRGRIALQDDLAGLDARLQQGGFRVGLQQPPTMETLLALPGIERIERLDTGHFLLFCDTAFEPAAFAREAVEQNWGLNELSPQMRTLEQVFIDITCREEADKEAAA